MFNKKIFANIIQSLVSHIKKGVRKNKRKTDKGYWQHKSKLKKNFWLKGKKKSLVWTAELRELILKVTATPFLNQMSILDVA